MLVLLAVVVLLVLWVASPTLPLLPDVEEEVEVTSVMVTPGWSTTAPVVDVDDVLDVVTVRLLVAADVAVLCCAACRVLEVVVVVVPDSWVADWRRVTLPSGLWITVSLASTRCMPVGAAVSAVLLSTASWPPPPFLVVPLCSLRLLVVTTPRSLAESYADDVDSRTTFQVPVVAPVVAEDV